jgi:hypothetical protein
MSYSSCSWHWLCKIALVPWCVRLSCKEKGHLVQRNSGADSAAGKSVTTTNGHSGSHALSQVPSLSTQRVRCSSLNDDCSCGGSALPSPRPDPDKAPFAELAYQPVTHPVTHLLDRLVKFFRLVCLRPKARADARTARRPLPVPGF